MQCRGNGNAMEHSACVITTLRSHNLTTTTLLLRCSQDGEGGARRKRNRAPAKRGRSEESPCANDDVASLDADDPEAAAVRREHTMQRGSYFLETNTFNPCGHNKAAFADRMACSQLA